MATKAFFDSIRTRLFGGRISDAQLSGISSILKKSKRARANRESTAYIMATAFHETGATMAPVKENLNYSAHGLRKTFAKYFTEEEAKAYARDPEAIANRAYANRMGNGDEDSGDGWRYRGRGYVQLTGRNNYAKMGAILDDDFENNPDLVTSPGYAASILVTGMMEGMFTGVSLDDVSEPGTSGPDFADDRKVVNGRDRADMIAGYANIFYDALELGKIDMLSDSRTIKAAKASTRTSDVGILVSGGALVKQVTDALSAEPEGIINAARQGITLGTLLPWLGAGAASLFIGLFVYNRVMAKRVEAARREDNDVLGV